MKAEEGRDPAVGLQLRLVDIEVHAIDAFDFQGHVLADDFGYRPWYAHGWLRSASVPTGPLPLCGQIGAASADPVIGSTGAFCIYLSV